MTNSLVYYSRKSRVLRSFFNQGFRFMNYLERIEKNIRKSFPDITERAFNERMDLVKHLIAFQHQSKRHPAKSTCSSK